MKNDVSEVILNKGVRFAPTSPNDKGIPLTNLIYIASDGVQP